MKAALQSFYANPKYTRVFEWGKLITITGGAQIFIQAIGLVSGILIVRLLPTQEYALYTLSNTMLGTMTLLADGGISTGVMAESGKVWQDREKLGVVLVTGLALRRKFAMVSLILFVPVLLYLLLHQGASIETAICVLLAIMLAFYTSLSGGILQVAPRLHQQIAALQQNQVKANLGRIILSLLFIALFPFSFFAILAAGLPQLWANRDLKKITLSYVDWTQAKADVVQTRLLIIVRRLLPGMIYYCFVGQIIIWILSIAGNSTSLAQIGALGRLSMIFNIFTVLNATLIVPRFARLPNDRKYLLSIFSGIMGILGLIGICSIGICWLFSSEILSLLGEKYTLLNLEFILSITSSFISLAAGIAFSLFTARGWTMNPYLNIGFNISLIVVGINLFDLTTLIGSVLFSVVLSIGQFFLNALFCLTKILFLERIIRQEA